MTDHADAVEHTALTNCGPDQSRPPAHTLVNADVLEVIAECACGTVQDACALRAANKGYRRAVDTTVRRWVYEDQPEVWIALGKPSKGAPLVLHSDPGSKLLDSVRIALTCDAFPRIARLVVVAFALDGAKDELHEGAECGPRPVVCSEMPFPEHTAGSDVSSSCFCSTWLAVEQLPQPARPAAHLIALAACATTMAVSVQDLTDTFFEALEDPASCWWGCVTHLQVTDVRVQDDDLLRLSRLLIAVGPQLTHLCLCCAVSAVLCPAIATCRRLQYLRIDRECASRDLCDALVASGAPLASISARVDASDGERLLTAMEATVVDANIQSLHPEFPMPPGAVRGTSSFSARVRMPRSASITITRPEDWRPSAHATSIVVHRPSKLGIGNLAAAYPALRRLFVGDGLAEDVAPEDLRFPATMECFTIESADAGAVVEQLSKHCLRNLRTVNFRRIRFLLDIRPLAVFAGTLTHLVIETTIDFKMKADEVARTEITIAQLHALEVLQVPALPTARCLLAGNHTHLRHLSVLYANAPDARFEQLLRACPRLATCRNESAYHSFTPPGWRETRTFGESSVRRVSFS